MLTPTNTTLLDLGATVSSSPYATRGIHQVLKPVPQKASQRRTVNGTLVDLSVSQFEKYVSQITCEDMEVPGLDGVWQGAVIDVSCVAELSFKTSGGSASRTAVANSTRTEGALTFYRPVLTMMVVDFKYETDEWGAKVSWELDLEEV